IQLNKTSLRRLAMGSSLSPREGRRGADPAKLLRVSRTFDSRLLAGSPESAGLTRQPLARQMVPQHIGTEIGAVRPDDRSAVRIDAHEREISGIAQRLEYP